MVAAAGGAVRRLWLANPSLSGDASYVRAAARTMVARPRRLATPAPRTARRTRGRAPDHGQAPDHCPSAYECACFMPQAGGLAARARHAPPRLLTTENLVDVFGARAGAPYMPWPCGRGVMRAVLDLCSGGGGAVLSLASWHRTRLQGHEAGAGSRQGGHAAGGLAHHTAQARYT